MTHLLHPETLHLPFEEPFASWERWPSVKGTSLKQEFIDGTHGTQTWTTTLVYEQRLGTRGQWELSLPYTVKETRDRTTAGPGDLALTYKHVLSTHTAALALTAAALEVVVPLGECDRGLDDGTLTLYTGLRFRGHVALRIDTQLPVAGT
ncbi:MAG: hypothetical protein J4F42_17800, partial [Desulfurellaceae bacterium]|nr:hypothetical protein [Desulfurellaceae bacterium]